MTGTGMIVLIVALIANLSGLDFDDKQITETAEATILLFGFGLSVIGQLMRRDLTWGMFRKEPLE